MSLCPWVEDLAVPMCCDGCSWESVPDDLKLAAIDWATTVIWAATGRQFGLCEVTVRPCRSSPCGDGGLTWMGSVWNGGLWTPYILDGVWYNCACPGLCSCDPRCQVMLDGPVASITEVTISGVVVDPDTYRVDDYRWLVRQDIEECWPDCPDMNVASGGPGSFEVTYMKGTPVPTALLRAVGILACEWIKMCNGDSGCRLSSRVVSMTRNNVDFQFVSPSEMLTFGWTGIAEVDMLISAYNPYGLKFRPRVWSTAISHPRQTTWP
jgi:hypothetical protein